ncbi:MAG: AraC family transcriptional regulator [Elusimicrobiales bacterium]
MPAQPPALSDRLLETDFFCLSRYEHAVFPHKDPSEEWWRGWHVVFTETERWHYRDGYSCGEINSRTAVLGSPGRYYKCRHDAEIPSDVCLDIELRAGLENVWEKGFPNSVIRLTPRLMMLKQRLYRLSAAGPGGEEADNAAGQIALELARIFGVSWPETAAARRRDCVFAAQEFMRKHFFEKLRLADLSASVGMSRFHFTRIFSRHSGQSPYQYLVSMRLAAAEKLLVETGEPVTAIAHDCGFENLSLFINSFRRRFGVSPSKYRVAKSGK